MVSINLLEYFSNYFISHIGFLTFVTSIVERVNTDNN